MTSLIHVLDGAGIGSDGPILIAGDDQRLEGGASNRRQGVERVGTSTGTDDAEGLEAVGSCCGERNLTVRTVAQSDRVSVSVSLKPLVASA